jgi:hypothetical protein
LHISQSSKNQQQLHLLLLAVLVGYDTPLRGAVAGTC